MAAARDLFLQQKDHPSIGEARNFVQALLDGIGDETNSHGGHAVGYPGGTANRLNYLEQVGLWFAKTPADREPRTLQFSNPSTSIKGIANISGGEFDKLTIEGSSGSVSIRKNEPVSVVLAKIRFEAGPTGPAPRKARFPFFARFTIPNPPTIDGVQLQTWNYPFDVLLDGKLHTLIIRKMSTALRSVHFPRPLSILGPTEELAISAPRNGLALTAQADEGAVTSTIEAELVLRDFAELGPAVPRSLVSIAPPLKPQPNSNRVSRTGKIGRNEQCPCGSGKKYKKCHGR